MADETEKSDLRKVAEYLAPYGVEFIVIGGQAETLMGSPRVTYDIDLCYRRTAANLERLASALRDLKPTLRGVPPGLPLLLDARALALGNNYTFDTRLGKIDLLGWVEPLGDFDAVRKNAQTFRVADLELQVISLEDLIRVKEHICRSKDAESLFQLRAVQKLRQKRET